MILTGFQFRAARRSLNLTLEQLHKNTGILKGALSRIDNTTNNLDDIVCYAKDAEILLNYFNQNKIIFSDKNIITLDMDIEPKPIENNLTRFQFISARAALRVTQEFLSQSISIPESVITEYERKFNDKYIVSRYLYLDRFIDFFKSQGLVFPSNLSVQIIK